MICSGSEVMYFRGQLSSVFTPLRDKFVEFRTVFFSGFGGVPFSSQGQVARFLLSVLTLSLISFWYIALVSFLAWRW